MRLNEIKTHAQCETKETHRAAEMPFRQPQSLAFDCDADGLSPLTSQRRSLGAYFSLSFFIIVPPPPSIPVCAHTYLSNGVRQPHSFYYQFEEKLSTGHYKRI